MADYLFIDIRKSDEVYSRRFDKSYNYDVYINVIGTNSFNLYNIMRITQIILGSLILLIGSYTLYATYSYKNINKLPLIILILFGAMALFNGLTSTCTISTIFIDSLN